MAKNAQEMIFRVDIELCQHDSWAQNSQMLCNNVWGQVELNFTIFRVNH